MVADKSEKQSKNAPAEAVEAPRQPGTPAAPELSDEELGNVAGGTGSTPAPRDASTGMATGKRMYKPITTI